MNHTSRFLITLSLGASAFLLAGCGDSTPSTASATEAAAATDGARTIKVTADDAMRFSLSEIQAKPGETLRVTLANTGRIPVQAMAHNWVLLTPGTDAELNAFGMAAASATPTYIPAQYASRVLAHTKLLGPGEKDTIEFTAPETPGEYPFLCTFPGHFAMMKGKLIVK